MKFCKMLCVAIGLSAHPEQTIVVMSKLTMEALL